MAAYWIEISRGIDIEIHQHRFVERLARQEDVKAFLHRIFDIDEVLTDPGRAKPHGAFLAEGPLVHARASPIHERVTAQLDGDFRVAVAAAAALPPRGSISPREGATIAGRLRFEAFCR